MKTAYVCDTAYQVFNILNFKQHTKDEVADLFLCDFFPTARKLYQSISEQGLFHSVVLTAPHYRKEGESRLRWYSRHAATYLFPGHSLRRDMLETPVKSQGYERIYTCSLNHIAVCLLALNPGAELLMIDDGAGSYYADPSSDSVSGLHRIFAKLTGTGAHAVSPRAIYLYDAAHAASHTAIPVRQMPRPTEDFLAETRELFGETGLSFETEKTLIWLTQPDEYEKSTVPTDKKIRDALRDNAPKVLVRRHPRDRRDSFYMDFTLDQSGAMWELAVPLLEIETKLLLGIYSTAQMTPKLLYDLEPTTVFLFRLYREVFPADWITGFARAVEELRETYREKEKVLVPETIEELRELLKERV